MNCPSITAHLIGTVPFCSQSIDTGVSLIQYLCGHLLDDFKNSTFFTFGGGDRTQNSAHGHGCSALLADDLSQIFFGHREFQNKGMISRHFRYADLLGVVYQ
jgi:hypothetical protein